MTARKRRQKPTRSECQAALPPRRSSERERESRGRYKPEPKDQLDEERDDAGDDHGDDHHTDVAVADMGQFMAEDGFDFSIVEPVKEAVVTVIEYCLAFIPVEKALSASE